MGDDPRRPVFASFSLFIYLFFQSKPPARFFFALFVLCCAVGDVFFVFGRVGRLFGAQGIADVVETLLEDVDSYLDDASGKGANQQVGCFYVFGC